jgi:hypothetical protein
MLRSGRGPTWCNVAEFYRQYRGEPRNTPGRIGSCAGRDWKASSPERKYYNSGQLVWRWLEIRASHHSRSRGFCLHEHTQTNWMAHPASQTICSSVLSPGIKRLDTPVQWPGWECMRLASIPLFAFRAFFTRNEYFFCEITWWISMKFGSGCLRLKLFGEFSRGPYRFFVICNLLEVQLSYSMEPVTVAARSKAWTVFARSESHLWDGCLVCVCVYSVFVLSCV